MFDTSINQHLFFYRELNNGYVITVTDSGPFMGVFLESGTGSITPKVTPWDFTEAMKHLAIKANVICLLGLFSFFYDNISL